MDKKIYTQNTSMNLLRPWQTCYYLSSTIVKIGNSNAITSFEFFILRYLGINGLSLQIITLQLFENKLMFQWSFIVKFDLKFLMAVIFNWSELQFFRTIFNLL